MPSKAWIYTGAGEYIPGVPARDLTADGFKGLTPLAQADVVASKLYKEADPKKGGGKK